MWIIKQGATQTNMVNENGDSILAALQASFPGATYYRNTSTADHEAAIAHLSATLGNPAAPGCNTVAVDDTVTPPVLDLKDHTGATVGTQTLEVVT